MQHVQASLALPPAGCPKRAACMAVHAAHSRSGGFEEEPRTARHAAHTGFRELHPALHLIHLIHPVHQAIPGSHPQLGKAIGRLGYRLIRPRV